MMLHPESDAEMAEVAKNVRSLHKDVREAKREVPFVVKARLSTIKREMRGLQIRLRRHRYEGPQRREIDGELERALSSVEGWIIGLGEAMRPPGKVESGE